MQKQARAGCAGEPASWRWPLLPAAVAASFWPVRPSLGNELQRGGIFNNWVYGARASAKLEGIFAQLFS
jgi:hypothetical protein